MTNADLTKEMLDAWIADNPRVDAWGRTYLMSRYSALKELYGETVATWTLQELAIQQCS